MLSNQAHIISKLQREILPLQGFKPPSEKMALGLGAIEQAFPAQSFPVGAIHEFICPDAETVSASGGFISTILGRIIRNNGVAVWISSSQNIFVPALKLFGVDPQHIIFIHLNNQKEKLWAMEESLKCEGLAAVIGEIPELTFTVSRRFQLAVEQSRVTGFIIRHTKKQPGTTACISRWQISSLPSLTGDDMPGVGFPHWNVELLKVRNGRPGNWQVKCAGNKFEYIPDVVSLLHEQQRKTG